MCTLVHIPFSKTLILTQPIHSKEAIDTQHEGLGHSKEAIDTQHEGLGHSKEAIDTQHEGLGHSKEAIDTQHEGLGHSKEAIDTQHGAGVAKRINKNNYRTKNFTTTILP